MILATVLQAGVNINSLAVIGVGALITVMILSVLAQLGLSYLAQRNVNDQLSLGIQGIVGTNNLRVVDNAQEDPVVGEESDNDNNGS
jgi:hypothetical protein